jgi:creatinine amidohydrolase
MPKPLWFDLTARDFATLDPARTIAVLPIAATEQHGPHLSVGTDAIIAGGLCAEVIRRLPKDLAALFMPVLAIGASAEHLRAPGTLSLSPETLLRMLAEIGDSVARAGLRKLVIVNAHGGNAEIMGLAVRDLRIRHAMLAVQASWQKLGLPEGLFSEEEMRFGIHGGDYETSLMLHFAAERVRMDRAADFTASGLRMAEDHALLRLTGPISMGWIAEDAHTEGVAGEAHRATAKKGAQTAAHLAERFIALLRDVERFDLKDLAS